MFPSERDKIVRSSQFAYPFRWKLITSSNFIDIVWCSCTIKINRLNEERDKYENDFFWIHVSHFQVAFPSTSAGNFWILIQIEHTLGQQ